MKDHFTASMTLWNLEVCNLNANYPLILLKVLIVLTCLYKLQAIPVECTKQEILETS